MFASVFIVFCILFIHSLSLPFFWDDYHLIRSFSSAEFISSLTGSWDPDNIETPGYRPLTLIFNWFRYLCFGENTTAHRIFLIILLSLLFCQIYIFATAFIKNHTLCFFAALFPLVFKYNYIHISWIADGIHIFQANLCMAAAIFLIHQKYIPAWFMSAAALFCREDSLGFLLAIIIIAAHRKINRQLILYAVFFLIFTVSLFIARSFFVPSESIHIFNIFDALYALFLPAGFIAWPLSFLVLVCVLLCRNNQSLQIHFLMILCIIVSSLHTIVILRSNVLLLPSIFVSLFFAYAIQKSIFSTRLILPFICAFLILCTAQNVLQQHSMRAGTKTAVKGLQCVFKEQIAEKNILSISKQQFLFTQMKKYRQSSKFIESCTEYDMFQYSPLYGLFDLE